jgi:hypothetical protein
MTDKNEKKRIGFATAIGIVIGMILYKVIVDLLWPMIFG